MTWAHVQHIANSNVSGVGTTGVAATLPGVVAGNTLIATTQFGGTVGATASISDTQGNAWTKVYTFFDNTFSSGVQLTVFACVAKASGSNAVTATWASGVSSYLEINLGEFSGGAASVVIDVGSNSHNGASSGTSVSGGSFTTTSANDLLIEYFWTTSTGATAAPWTSMIVTTGDPTGYQLNKAAGTYSAAGTLSPSGAYVVITAALSDTVPPGPQVDPSTPQIQTGSTPSQTTTYASASFSPPANSLLVVVWIYGGSTLLTGMTDSLASHLTYRQLVGGTGFGGGGGSGSIWVADVPAVAPGSMTVSGVFGSSISLVSNNSALVVLVLTAAATAANQTGATQTAGASGSGGLVSGTIASLIGSNSLVVGWGQIVGTTGPPTPAASQTVTFNGQVMSGNYANLSFVQRRTDWLSSGSAATINDTAPTAPTPGGWDMAMAEILAAGPLVPQVVPVAQAVASASVSGYIQSPDSIPITKDFPALSFGPF